MYAMTAAHKTLPIPVYARVTNLANGRSVVVRVNDRGPFVGDRLIDLSWTAASRLDMLRGGTTPVEVRVITPGENTAAIPAPATLTATPMNTNAAPLSPPPDRITPPAPAPAVAAPAVAAPSSGSWLQAASFSDVTNAKKLVQRLADSGIRNAQVVEADSNGRRIWRVRVGPIASREELDDFAERLNLFGIPDARLAHD
jgi:rare lipoprotein A